MYSFEKSEIMKKVKKIAKGKNWLINLMESFLERHGHGMKFLSEDVMLHIYRSELLYLLDSNASMAAEMLKSEHKELDGDMLDAGLSLYTEIFGAKE